MDHGYTLLNMILSEPVSASSCIWAFFFQLENFPRGFFLSCLTDSNTDNQDFTN